MARRKAESRAVVTESGLVVKGDSDHRPGDLVMTPLNRVETIVAILPPTPADYAGFQPELELYMEDDNA